MAMTSASLDGDPSGVKAVMRALHVGVEEGVEPYDTLRSKPPSSRRNLLATEPRLAAPFRRDKDMAPWMGSHCATVDSVTARVLHVVPAESLRTRRSKRTARSYSTCRSEDFARRGPRCRLPWTKMACTSGRCTDSGRELGLGYAGRRPGRRGRARRRRAYRCFVLFHGLSLCRIGDMERGTPC